MSGSVNKVILVGRLGRDPEVKFTPSGQALTKFPMATDEFRKDADGNRVSQTEWHNIVLWGKQAETAGEYLKKGSLVYVEGRIQTRSWDDQQTGQKRYMTEIVGLRFTMLGPRGEGSPSAESESGSQTQQTRTPEAEDEDLPF